MDHLPDVRFPDRATKDTYLAHLRELGERPQVYIKLSEVVHKWGDRVSTDLNAYRDWLDELWSIFGEDRVKTAVWQRLAAKREPGVQLVSQRVRRRTGVRQQ